LVERQVQRRFLGRRFGVGKSNSPGAIGNAKA
jgi:hypothetical protein